MSRILCMINEAILLLRKAARQCAACLLTFCIVLMFTDFILQV